MFACDVRDGLSKPGQKELPCQYFYDEVGSALFEAITVLPEYGLTRADARLVRSIDKAGKAIRWTKPSGRREQTQRLVAPRPTKRMFRNWHELDMREAQIGDVRQQAVGQHVP